MSDAAYRRHRQEHVAPFAECWTCGRDRAVCRSKIRFATWQEAREWIDEYHLSREFAPPWMRRYSCDWCGGYHATSGLYAHEVKRVEKQRRKWIAARRPTP